MACNNVEWAEQSSLPFSCFPENPVQVVGDLWGEDFGKLGKEGNRYPNQSPLLCKMNTSAFCLHKIC